MVYQNVRRFFYKRLKKIEWVYALNYRVSLYKELKNSKNKMKHSKLKTKGEIEQELNSLKKYWHCYYTDYYIFYELFNKKLTLEQLLDYVPPYYFANFHQEAKQKGIDIIRYKNKLNQYYLFKEKGVKTSPVIAVYKKGALSDINGLKMGFEDLIGKFLKTDSSKLFIKPVFGEGGTGILVLKKIEDNLVINGTEIRLNDLANILKSTQTYIFEERISQREDINQINSTSVNTLRVIVQRKENRMQLSVCILRMGRNDSEIDNSAKGGLSIQVDTETGEFYDYATAEHGGGLFSKHPDSQFVFKNQKIYDWHRIKEEILLYSNLLIDFNDIALDVAITNDGIEIIEMNFGYGIDHLQCTCGGMCKVLSVKTP